MATKGPYQPHQPPLAPHPAPVAVCNLASALRRRSSEESRLTQVLRLFGDDPHRSPGGQVFYGLGDELGVQARVDGVGQSFAQFMRQLGPVIRAK